MSDAATRRKPNILVTGTPGVGKTATATLIAERLGMKHIKIGEIISQNKCHTEYDESLQTHVLDEDKLLDLLELEFDNDAQGADDDDDDDHSNDDDDDERGKYQGNLVADYHACELFPERWFDLILVLRADTHVLYDRLVKRGYSENKRNENMQCEIMQVVLDEARESYAKEIVQELRSNTLQEMEQNVERVEAWYQQWTVDHKSS
mmetsp:Transcript_11642/g.13540  ORF Transcript_11642/g.13540 Transcript_11642/m.13540 type:complete len:206 (+) Transcript_11642:66-683(+)